MYGEGPRPCDAQDMGGSGSVGKTMSNVECNYGRHLTPEQLAEASQSLLCHRCSISQSELLAKGKTLEVCGEEFMWDPSTQIREMTTITLCPECHAEEHRDAKGHHDPCQVSARRTRERFSYERA